MDEKNPPLTDDELQGLLELDDDDEAELGVIARRAAVELVKLRKINASANIEALLRHIDNSPLGWSSGKVMIHRSTTELDVVEWLEELRKLQRAVQIERSAEIERTQAAEV